MWAFSVYQHIERKVWHFVQVTCEGDNLHVMSNCFRERYHWICQDNAKCYGTVLLDSCNKQKYAEQNFPNQLIKWFLHVFGMWAGPCRRGLFGKYTISQHPDESFYPLWVFIVLPYTDNPLYTDTRYNDIIRYNDDLTGTNYLLKR